MQCRNRRKGVMYVTTCMIYSCVLRVAGCGMRVACCWMRVTSYELRVTGCELRVTSYGQKGQRAWRIVVREQKTEQSKSEGGMRPPARRGHRGLRPGGKSEKGKVRWIGERMFFTQSD